MATIDVTGLSYFLPLFSFLLVFIITYSVLFRTKLTGENQWVQLLSSFIVATIFIIAIKPNEFVLSIIPWFAVMLIAMFLVLAFTGFIGGMKEWESGIGKGMIVIMLLIFLVSAFLVFSSSITPYLPGGSGGNTDVSAFFNWVYSSNVAGAIILLAVAGLVSWILVSAKK